MATHMVSISPYCTYSFFDNVTQNTITYATKHERKTSSGKIITYYGVTIDHLKLAGISAPEHRNGCWSFAAKDITEL